jgi:hypothetical protein
MGIIQSLFSGGANELVETVGKVVDNVTATKEEKLQLEPEMKNNFYDIVSRNRSSIQCHTLHKVTPCKRQNEPD